MILSSACQPWHADLPGQKPESVAINAVSYTTSRDAIRSDALGLLKSVFDQFHEGLDTENLLMSTTKRPHVGQA